MRLATRMWREVGIAPKNFIAGLIVCGMLFIGSNRSEGRLQVFAQKTPIGRFTFTEYHMGVDTRLIVYAANQEIAERACSAAFERIADLDKIMSDYQIHSELNWLCDQPRWADKNAKGVRVSHDLFRVLAESQALSRDTNGMFDVTVGPLVRLWRKARKTGILPKLNEIRHARALVGWQKMSLDFTRQTVKLAQPGMKLDLGAIGKGYADDAAQEILKQHGVLCALVEMGGDIVVSSSPPGEKGWKIAVPNSDEDDHDAKAGSMLISNCAISTSGDTEEFAMIGGKRYSHVINPLTGQPLNNRVQATVIAKTGSLSDPLSTSMTLVEESVRRRLLQKYPGTKIFVKILK